MLWLLLKTRLRYYRNFIRANFDRVTLIELALIVVILLFLTARSPADIGYSLKFLLAPDFPQRWQVLGIALLPFFYLISEMFAVVTLRPTGEWQVLGALPFSKPAIIQYQLLRHFSKTATLILLGIVLFLLGEKSVVTRALHCSFAVVVLLALQLAAFTQAYALRRSDKSVLHRFGRWLPFEVLFFSILIFGGPHLHHVFAHFRLGLLAASVATIVLAGFWFLLERTYAPGLVTERNARPRTLLAKFSFRRWMANVPNFATAQILRDLIFLQRKRRAILWAIGAMGALFAFACSVQEHAQEVYSAAIVMQVFYNWLMINSLIVLFEQETHTISALRPLPIRTTSFWWARWWLVTALLALPMLVAVLIGALKFGITLAWAGFFASVVILLPAIFSSIFCSAAFGMFPYTRYASLMLNFILMLVLLFWFYMPFGSLLLVILVLTWSRKSQRRFQLVEVG